MHAPATREGGAACVCVVVVAREESSHESGVDADLLGVSVIVILRCEEVQLVHSATRVTEPLLEEPLLSHARIGITQQAGGERGGLAEPNRERGWSVGAQALMKLSPDEGPGRSSSRKRRSFFAWCCRVGNRERGGGEKSREKRRREGTTLEIGAGEIEADGHHGRELFGGHGHRWWRAFQGENSG